ncbi:MAG: Ig-like domain-containing protein [Gemmatimonadota bacterium]|nr:Ig-like domain-containing protein [Gemmatimonadota bacterium]MDE2984207.1 Ig-like domain-containing protein [Gemmatimonadota bacterium]
MTITPEAALLTSVGDTVRLVARVLDEYQRVIAGFPVSWSSSSGAVATVGESGYVRAVGEGEATIRATADSVSATSAITVVLDRDRAGLMSLYHAAGGPEWVQRRNWLTDAPLGEWDGVEVDAQGRVTGLELSWNNMNGTLPPELGRMEMLKVLDLGYNPQVVAPLSPGFYEMEMLEELHLPYTDTRAKTLSDFLGLPRLRTLNLYGSGVSGPMPPELVGHTALRNLNLGLAQLTGTIPPGIVEMPHLANLSLLQNHQVTGSLPEDIGRLSTLTGLNLTGTGMSGTLPLGLTEIEGLDTLLTGETELCGPDEERFWHWLRGVQKQRVAPCTGPKAVSAAYLVQQVQSREFPVPFVADEEALLRVFVVAPRAEGQPMPPVRATFYLDGAQVEVVELTPDSSFIRNVVDESELASSANAVIPASVIQPGLEMVVEIDPDGTMDPELGVATRIPETGRIDLDVREMPVLPLTLVPFLYAPDPDSSLLERIDGMTAEDTLLWGIRTLMPVREVDLTVHKPVSTNTTSPLLMMNRTEAIRVAESGRGYFMGTLPASQANYPGVSTIGTGWSSFSIPDAWVMVHELGHNLGLLHARCGPNLTNADPMFPDPNGKIGAWGYRMAGGVLVPPTKPDFMSYCGPDVWVSEFYFSNMFRYRFELGDLDDGPASVAAGPSLLVWGGVGPDGSPFLEPAFVLDGAVTLPRETGPYRLTGIGTDGRELFSLSFAMTESADGEGGSSFVFAVPAETSWGRDLVRIRLTGPEGGVSLDAESERAGVIVRDPLTGRIRGIFTGLLAGMTRAEAVALSPESGLEILFSRGLPDVVEWEW